MQVKKLLTDDEGVSPVIGVILMVAITVILAAVIAAFVLGIGDTEDPAPSASLEYEIDDSNDEITISHDSGDSFTASDVVVNLDDDGATGNTVSDGTTLDEVSGLGSDEEFGPGDSLTIGTSSPTVLTNSGSSTTVTIELVWAPGGGDAQSIFSDDEFRNVNVGIASGAP